MTTAHHLRLIDGMRTRDFPLERTPSDWGVSGPGYHAAFLRADHQPWGDDEPSAPEHRAQCLAEHDALLTLLAARWGEPQVMSLWSAQERMTAGEMMADPWADPVAGCEFLQLWRVEERWIAVGLVLEDGGPGCELTVLVTVVDPP
ncbi:MULTISPECIES: hypothetical protein [unclassified Streptomyces]|uniref:hypothetical protein n=1 Tax=Streptomyces TaxID=1883 RepID=UPI000FD789F0|nr:MULTISPECIES: hypothetical protein [unclassified Streptomyces]UQA32813.1 hypothetical protein KRR37_03030 [Streptomyces sp. HNA39]